jgi:hypothetical protein
VLFIFQSIYVSQPTRKEVDLFIYKLKSLQALPFKAAKLLHSAAKGCGGELGKTDATAVFFAVLIENKGFWNFFGRKLHAPLAVGGVDVFFRHRRNGCRVGIEYPNDIAYANILIVSNVKIHSIILPLSGVRSAPRNAWTHTRFAQA